MSKESEQQAELKGLTPMCLLMNPAGSKVGLKIWQLSNFLAESFYLVDSKKKSPNQFIKKQNPCKS